MYKTLFCLSAALLVNAGAFAEEAQTFAQDQAIEETLAGCNCGNKTKKTQEGSEGDKGNGNKSVACDAQDAPEITLTCGKCGK